MTISANVDNLQGSLMNEYGTIENDSLARSAMNQIVVLQSPEIVTTYALSQNYPNPFNPATIISYQIPKDGRVTIKILDVIGREVTTLVDEFKSSGQYSVKFDAPRFSTGIYFYSIKSGDYNAMKKMALIR
jgi:Secretion system C-terminal sorting domain